MLVFQTATRRRNLDSGDPLTNLLSYILRLGMARHPCRLLVPIVVTDPSGEDRSAWREAADRECWNLHFTNSSEEAWTIAKQLKAPVILCDRDLPEIEWRQTVRTLAALPHRPMVILLSKFADQSLWSEVFRSGGFDILRKPLRTEDVRKAVNLALSYWRSEAAAGVKTSG